MGVTFCVRGDSLTPRYSGGQRKPAYLPTLTSGVIGPAVDATAIGGNSIDASGTAGTGTQMGVKYGAQGNVAPTDGSFGGDWSVLQRVKFPGTPGTDNISSLFGLYSETNGFPYPQFSLYYWKAGGGIRAFMSSDAGLIGINGVYTANTFAADTWYDMGYQWDNSAQQLKLYQDGVLLGTVSSSRTLGSPDISINNSGVVMSFACSGEWHQSTFLLNEMVFWDELVDFTGNFDLTSGSGALNGASRTAFLDVAEFDGLAGSGGGGGSKNKGFTVYG